MEEREQLAQLWEKVLEFINSNPENWEGICNYINAMKNDDHIDYAQYMNLLYDLGKCRSIPVRYNMREMSPGIFSDCYYWIPGDFEIRKWFIQERIKDLRGICTQWAI